MTFQYELIDVRTIDGQPLLASPQTSDNVIAVLAGLPNRRAALKTIVGKIGESDVEERAFYLQALLTLAGFRGLEEAAKEEARKVPILNDILENKVLGREYKKGEVALLRRMIEKRFGAVPAWVDKHLQERTSAELEELGVRLLDAPSLDDLLR